MAGLGGFDLPASSMPLRRAPNCATGPRRALDLAVDECDVLQGRVLVPDDYAVLRNRPSLYGRGATANWLALVGHIPGAEQPLPYLLRVSVVPGLESKLNLYVA